jgi:anthranilate phosphoribosyltransferase
LADIKALHASNAAESKAIIEGILNGATGPCRDIVLLNAGAAIYAANLAVTLEDGINAAHEVIASGAAKAKLDALIAFTQKLNRQ